MRIVQINMWHKGSTGKIMFGIAECARNAGNEVLTFSPRVYQRYETMEEPEIDGHSYFGFRKENMLHYILARLAGMHGMYSFFGTMQLIRKLKRIKADIIHLHNLHNYTICLPLLFHYFKKSNCKVIWTFHDCWAMTGHCCHFVIAKCDKWKTRCSHCKQIKEYPKSYLDTTSITYFIKRRLFTTIDGLTVVVPSQWLKRLTEESYLGDCSIRVIQNGINLDIFKPTESDFCQKYHCKDKKIVLGVSMGWSFKKGLDVFAELASQLPEKYQLVLVGGDEQTDRQLPSNVISIHRTQDQKELAEIYTVADVFVNPTREDTFPTVNIESLACGTPVITFRTGGSPEIIDETCGSVVECNDVEALEREIIRICNDKPYSQEACVKRAQQFDQREKFKEYVKLYEDMAHNE